MKTNQLNSFLSKVMKNTKALALGAMFMAGTNTFAQSINNGSFNGTVGSNVSVPGWTPIRGYSPSSSTGINPPSIDILSTYHSSFWGPNSTFVTPSESPDGGSWVGMSNFYATYAGNNNSENEAIQQVITGLTVGKNYTITYYAANFGSVAFLNNPYPAQVRAYINGTQIASSTMRVVSEGWETVTGTFTATATTAVLQLDVHVASYTSGNYGYMSVDGVSINETCVPSSTAPPLTGTTLINTCPTATVDLNSLHTATPPSGTSLVWFTNNTHTGTAYATPAAATAGTYYAFYYNSTGAGCYSPASVAVTVSTTACCAADAGIIIKN